MKAITFILAGFLSIGTLMGQQNHDAQSTITSKQHQSPTITGSFEQTVPYRKFSVSTTFLSFVNFESEETNLHHYEIHVGYKISPKDRIQLKAVTWKLFEPMGIPLWDENFRKESEYYPGKLWETGLGVTYQRLLWKGLYAQIEVLPLYKTYLDTDDKEIGNGFKLYTTYHLGYHIPLFKNRFFIEPQVHCNYWPIDTNIPGEFKEKEDKWNNYFLFEPNLYIGVKF
jgi:hypothetical protein